MKNVTIIQRVLPHYRLQFFRLLRESLYNEGVDFRLIYGQEYPGTVPKTATLEEPWAIRINNIYMQLPGASLVWQPCIGHLKESSLIIIEQANCLLVNYFILSPLISSRKKVAYWGHGKNFQTACPTSMKEMFKRFLTNRVNWWFAYTDRSACVLRESGFPKRHITLLNNTIDTTSLTSSCETISMDHISEVLREINIQSDNICVYCGGMYANKRLQFLVEACKLIRDLVPDFHMIFIGDGPLQQFVAETCASYSWMHYVGPKFGSDKVLFLKAAKALLMPGPVGLVMIDSFVARLPLFTTDITGHGPEIAYLQNGTNGIMTENSLQAYAQTVAKFLCTPEQLKVLEKGCEVSSGRYTLENMVNNFTRGVIACLAEEYGK